MSEKEFDMMDDQFRDAAEQYQPEFDETSWQKMESKLDAGKAPLRPAGWLWWATDLVMISLMIFMLVRISGEYRNTASPVQGNNIAVDQPVRSPGKSRTQHFAGGEKRNGSDGTNNPVSPGSRFASTPENTSGTQSELIRPKHSRNEAIPGSVSERKPLPPREISSATETTRNWHGRVDASSYPSSYPNRPSLEAVLSVEHNKPFATIEMQSPPAALRVGDKGAHYKQPAAILERKRLLEQNAGRAAAVASQKKAPRKGFFAYGVATPEWSFVPGRQMGRGVLNYGGGIGYSFNKKWSIQAGVFSSKKLYTAGPADYKPRPGSYYYNLRIYDVEAACNILEIPLMVNYNLFSNGRHSISLGAGLASLVMNKEEYHYDYMRLSGTRAYAAHTYQTGRFYPFSAAMLAPSYKLKVNDMFSLVGSPYAKLPVYGVGEGKVNLASTGFMIGLQLQAPAQNKPLAN